MIALTSTPLILIVLLPTVLIVGAIYLARKARGAALPKNAMSVIIVIFAVVFSSLSGIVGLVLLAGQQRDYSDCVYGVNRSFGSRDYSEHLIEVIAQNFPSATQIVADLHAELDKDLPLRSLNECSSLKP